MLVAALVLMTVISCFRAEDTNTTLSSFHHLQKRDAPSQIAILEAKMSAMETQMAAVQKLMALYSSGAAEDIKKIQEQVVNLRNNQTVLVSRLEEKERNNTARFEAQETKTTSLERRIDDVGAMVSILDENVRNNTARIGALANKTTSLEGRTADLAVSISRLQENERSNTARFSALETKTKSLERRIDDLARRTQVSFLAIHTSPQTVASNGVMKFSTVRHNSGNGYNSGTGRFRCPTSGVYAFFFHATTGGCDSFFQFGINMDSVTLTSTYAYTSKQTAIINCRRVITASAVHPCRSGQYVFIKNLSNPAPIYINRNGFTGFKIY